MVKLTLLTVVWFGQNHWHLKSLGRFPPRAAGARVAAGERAGGSRGPGLGVMGWAEPFLPPARPPWQHPVPWASCSASSVLCDQGRKTRR